MPYISTNQKFWTVKSRIHVKSFWPTPLQMTYIMYVSRKTVFKYLANAQNVWLCDTALKNLLFYKYFFITKCVKICVCSGEDSLVCPYKCSVKVNTFLII